MSWFGSAGSTSDDEDRGGLRSPAAGKSLAPRLRSDVVAFLREWLPPAATTTFREMIRSDPEGRHRSPHFASGFVVEQFLRGNGITEERLGVEDLEPIWPGLLREAVEDRSTANKAPSGAD